ncbi:MAG TPA: Rieske 2Fe-2S domain-containing protein [Chloroflexota bacterium]|nr:Rieske 2Fe-2S domain-containing protein [Chloroflexota bacterium]
MLSAQMNQRLTQTGHGTPGGELLRRYWWPVAVGGQLEPDSVIAVRLLGEDLALYRTEGGKLGLVAKRCAHRGASLVYGIPEEEGLRCAYHGWRYGPTGQCNDTPGEPADSTFKERVCIAGYPVEETGGLIFAYLGPKPAPLLPRWDLLVRDDLKREIGMTHLPINWLQAAENTMDPYHLEFLHTRYMNYVMKKQDKPPAAKPRRHLDIAFDVWEFGIMKRRLLEGEDPETSEEWLVGHPLIFPNTLALGGELGPRFEYRVPVDDTHLIVYHYFTALRGADEPPQETIPFYEVPAKHEDGSYVVDTVLGQDMMAWATQGAIADRTAERLGTTDRGLILFRKLLQEQLEKVGRGEDPMGVIRDPAKNNPMLNVPRERQAFFTHTGGMVDSPEEDPLAYIRSRRELTGIAPSSVQFE